MLLTKMTTEKIFFIIIYILIAIFLPLRRADKDKKFVFLLVVIFPPFHQIPIL